MPLITRPETTKLNWPEYLEYIKDAEREVRTQELQKKLDQMGPRAIFEAEGLIGGFNREPVLALVRFAMKSWSAEPPLKLRDGTVNMLVDGYALFYRKQNGRVRIEKPHRVKQVEFDEDSDDEVRSVIIDYKTNKINKATNRAIWHRETYYWDEPPEEDSDGEPPDREEHSVPYVAVVEYDEGATEDKIKEAEKVTVLPFWPYCGVRWVDGQSLLEPIKGTILRYESAVINVATDNDRHSSRKKTYSGVDRLKETGEKYELLPGTDSKAYYVDTHPEGLGPMFREMEHLEDRIRQITGAVKLAALHNASGIARLLELRPLLSQAESIRSKCREMMEKVFKGKKWSLHFPQLIPMTEEEREVAYRNLKEARADGVISEEEFITLTRMLRDLPKLGKKELAKRLAERKKRTQAAEALRQAAHALAPEGEDEEEEEDDAE